MVRDASFHSELPFGRLQSIVERVVTSSLRRDRAAPDVTQEAFVQILQGIDSLRDPLRVEAWIAAVAAYTVRRELRRRRRSPRLVWEHDAEAAAELSYSPDIENQLILRRLDAALAQLSVQDRTLLMQRASLTDSVQSLAADVGCSAATLRRRLARARRRLRKIMQNDAELRHLSAAAFRSYARCSPARLKP